MPYYILFSIAAIASVISFVTKLKLLITKVKSRMSGNEDESFRSVEIHFNHVSVTDLEKMAVEAKYERHRKCVSNASPSPPCDPRHARRVAPASCLQILRPGACLFRGTYPRLLDAASTLAEVGVALQDTPIGTARHAGRRLSNRRFAGPLAAAYRPLFAGTMNAYYLTKSMMECIDKADDSLKASTEQAKTCDLTPTQMILGFAAILSSTSMLGMKIVNVKLIRALWTEDTRLQLEREALLAELNQSLSSDMAEKVGEVVKRRLSTVAWPTKRPNPATTASPSAAPQSTPNAAAPTSEAANRDFVTSRNDAQGMRHTLALVNVQPAATAEPERTRSTIAIGTTRAQRAAPSEDSSQPAVRGQCPACERPVYNTDEGRFSLRGTYYHAECVKGPCGCCGNQVLGDQDRSRLGNVYFHNACPPAEFYR